MRRAVSCDSAPFMRMVRASTPNWKKERKCQSRAKTRGQFVQRYRTLDGVLAAGLFPTQAEMLRLYRLIATMDAKAPLLSVADQKPIWGTNSIRLEQAALNGDAIDRASDIVDRIGALIKKAPPQKEVVDLNAAILEVTSRWARSAPSTG